MLPLSRRQAEFAEQFDHPAVAHLLEVAVELSDRPEVDRLVQADHPVAERPEGVDSVWGTDRHRHDDLTGPGSPDQLERGDHRRPGGDTIVGEDHRAASNLGPGANAANGRLPAFGRLQVSVGKSALLWLI